VFQAFANFSQIILAHLCVDEKENEIPEFHEFLMSLNLKDCVVTGDAMHFQKNFEIAFDRMMNMIACL